MGSDHLSFLLAGWGWLLPTSLLGLATFGALSADLAYQAFACYTFMGVDRWASPTDDGLCTHGGDLTAQGTRSKHRLLFVGINLVALRFTAGAALRDPTLTLLAGLLLTAVCAPIVRHLVHAFRVCSAGTSLSSLLFRVLTLGLFGSLILQSTSLRSLVSNLARHYSAWSCPCRDSALLDHGHRWNRSTHAANPLASHTPQRSIGSSGPAPTSSLRRQDSSRAFSSLRFISSSSRGRPDLTLACAASISFARGVRPVNQAQPPPIICSRRFVSYSS